MKHKITPILLLLTLLLSAASFAQAQTRCCPNEPGAIPGPVPTVKQLKSMYNPQEWRASAADVQNPASAGIESFLVPGLGQVIGGNPGRGAIFFGAYAVSGTLAAVMLNAKTTTNEAYYNVNYIGSYVFLSTALAAWIWSICDAVQVAKLRNLYYQDLSAGKTKMTASIHPSVGLAGNSPTAGLALTLNF